VPLADRLLLGPGPSNPYPEATLAFTRPLLGHMDPEFLALMDDTMARLRTVFRTTNALTLPISGTGSAGMETCFVNLLEPDDTAIIGVNGVFGERMCEVARRCGADVVRVDAPWGEALDPQRLLDTHAQYPDARVVAVVHAETSTGVENTIAPLAALQDTDALLVVDTVTSLGGIPVDADAWGVDACYSGTQKCLGVPPGLSPVTFSPRAVERLSARSSPPQSWYLDLSLIAKYVGGDSRVYHHTAPVAMVFSLHGALGALLDEGLDTAWARHRGAGERLQRELPELGFRLVVADGHRLPQLTTAWLPDGADDASCARRCSRPTASKSVVASASSPGRRGASGSWATTPATGRSRRWSARCANYWADPDASGRSMCSR
jgi:alanine-glyoxylate transaminase/serine-glyoxylate transaminase/serine-pyruvate transaminase